MGPVIVQSGKSSNHRAGAWSTVWPLNAGCPELCAIRLLRRILESAQSGAQSGEWPAHRPIRARAASPTFLDAAGCPRPASSPTGLGPRCAVAWLSPAWAAERGCEMLSVRGQGPDEPAESVGSGLGRSPRAPRGSDPSASVPSSPGVGAPGPVAAWREPGRRDGRR